MPTGVDSLCLKKKKKEKKYSLYGVAINPLEEEKILCMESDGYGMFGLDL